MLQERFKLLTDTLEISGKELSARSGCDASLISKIRCGRRVPKRDSNSMKHIAAACISFCKDNQMTERLNALLAADTEVSGFIAEKDILKWLYQESNSQEKEAGLQTQLMANSKFGDRLSAVMTLMDISNISLSRALHIDASYISKFRTGIRSPLSNPDLTERICRELFGQALSRNLEEPLADLIGAPISPDSAENEALLYSCFCSWLWSSVSAKQAEAETEAIQKLLFTISCFPEVPASVKITDPAAAHCDHKQETVQKPKKLYYEDSGLQAAVTCFLNSVCEHAGKDILLYSDQEMEWMTSDPDFLAQWTFLMRKTILSGVNIHIIHNIDRSLAETVRAIECWLPLYLTGSVNSFYLNSSAGKRFTHTLFLCPGIACVEGVQFAGMEADGLYHYYTDSEHLDHFSKVYASMLAAAKPLVTMRLEKEGSKTASLPVNIPNLSNIRMSVQKSSVIIKRTDVPDVSFIVLHPLLCNALKTFLKEK